MTKLDALVGDKFDEYAKRYGGVALAFEDADKTRWWLEEQIYLEFISDVRWDLTSVQRRAYALEYAVMKDAKDAELYEIATDPVSALDWCLRGVGQAVKRLVGLWMVTVYPALHVEYEVENHREEQYG